MLARNTTLRFFNLSSNLITDEGFTAISRALMSNPASSLLDLQVSGTYHEPCASWSGRVPHRTPCRY
jgi:hypothetical protein